MSNTNWHSSFYRILSDRGLRSLVEDIDDDSRIVEVNEEAERDEIEAIQKTLRELSRGYYEVKQLA